MPLERDLRAQLERQHQAERDAAGGSETDRSATLASLADRLTRYVGDGEDAYLVDRPTTVPDDAPLVVFDTRPARNQLVPAMFIALEHTVAKVERRRAERLSAGGPPPLFPGDALMSDETWKLVQRRATGEFFNDLARRSRHLGLFMLAITQHLGDFDNEYGRPLLRSANMKLFFQQSIEELRYLQDTLGLSDNEVRLISRLKTAKGRYSRALLDQRAARPRRGQPAPRRPRVLARDQRPRPRRAPPRRRDHPPRRRRLGRAARARRRRDGAMTAGRRPLLIALAAAVAASSSGC